ncbi:hypothetical protein OS493_026870 [Desmophyllum pertusum]|uniref:Angiotensin-converting enzyme n=1 Tax=Desmophyllum pertusum TaxID=174260 RepID=A0A9W9ZB41_9CNID|nr:hypothetical protein OS493_026870 [Desmophyllum pertusum]
MGHIYYFLLFWDKPYMFRDSANPGFHEGCRGYHVLFLYQHLNILLRLVLYQQGAGQFQFHKAACKAAGFEGPLHQCSIYKSSDAGKKIREMLKLGKSKPWPEALEKLNNQRTMDVGPLKEYFWPLYLWLREQRCASNYTIVLA